MKALELFARVRYETSNFPVIGGAMTLEALLGRAWIMSFPVLRYNLAEHGFAVFGDAYGLVP